MSGGYEGPRILLSNFSIYFHSTWSHEINKIVASGKAENISEEFAYVCKQHRNYFANRCRIICHLQNVTYEKQRVGNLRKSSKFPQELPVFVRVT